MLTGSHKELCSDRDCECCRDLCDDDMRFGDLVHSTYISNVKRAKPYADSNMPVDQKKKRFHNSELCVSAEKKSCVDLFCNWFPGDQVDFICHLLSKVSHFQQSQINCYLDPLLKRDFIVSLQSRGVPYLAELILAQLDSSSLLSVELVSRGWQWSVAKYQLWRRLLAHCVSTDPVWHGLADRRGWLEFVTQTDPAHLSILLERRRLSATAQQESSDFALFHDHHHHHHHSHQSYNTDDSINKSKLDSNSRQPQHAFGMPVQCQCIHRSPIDVPSAFHSHNMSSNQDAFQLGGSPNPRVPNTTTAMGLESSDALSHEAIMFAHRFYKMLYPRIIRDIARVEDNWIRGHYHLTRISCRSDVTKGVYCLQYDKEKIVSGLRDDTIKVWQRIPKSTCPSVVAKTNPHSSPADPAVNPADVVSSNANRSSAGDEEAAPDMDVSVANNPSPTAASSDGYQCTQVLEGHSGSVLCLQYIGNLLISGSSDTTVRLWDLSNGCCLNVICHHAEAVLHLRFRNNVLVTCSKDRSIAVWDMGPWPKDVQLRQVLVGHRAAVNVVDFDDKYIVSASGDRTIKVWATDTCTYVRTLTGHRRGIACLQYRDRLVVSGSSDNTIRIWDIETGVCFRVLEGHEELVRCIRFDSKRIVSGAYDGKIKVWNLKAALNPRSKPNQLCIHTLQQHTGRVFRLQFDDFQIVSSSHDDTILIWDFAHSTMGSEERDDGFDDGINAALASSTVCNCAAVSTTTTTTTNHRSHSIDGSSGATKPVTDDSQLVESNSNPSTTVGSKNPATSSSNPFLAAKSTIPIKSDASTRTSVLATTSLGFGHYTTTTKSDNQAAANLDATFAMLMPNYKTQSPPQPTTNRIGGLVRNLLMGSDQLLVDSTIPSSSGCVTSTPGASSNMSNSTQSANIRTTSKHASQLARNSHSNSSS